MLDDAWVTTSTTRLAYKSSRNRLQPDGFINYLRSSGYLADAWAWRLAPPTTRYILCYLSSSLAREQDAIMHSAYFQRQLSCCKARRCKTTRKILIHEAFEDYLGKMIVNHYFWDCIPK
jgi:hypothetical protein